MKALMMCLVFLGILKSTEVGAQELPTPDFLNQQFVFDNKIQSALLVDSASAIFSAFTKRYRYFEFDYNGRLIKSEETYDSLAAYKENIYYYYSEANLLTRKDQRNHNGIIDESFRYDYTPEGRLAKKEYLVYKDDGESIQSSKNWVYHWEADSIRIEHALNEGYFDILKFDKQGREVESLGNYKKKYNSFGLAEKMGLTGLYNDKPTYRHEYVYSTHGRLERVKINDNREVELYQYDENNRPKTITLADGKTSKLKNKTTVVYKTR
jgi:YD repeat-containing protein